MDREESKKTNANRLRALVFLLSSRSIRRPEAGDHPNPCELCELCVETP
jgi:hypothetical protein